jgi:hypothetical protein
MNRYDHPWDLEEENKLLNLIKEKKILNILLTLIKEQQVLLKLD